MRIAPRKTRKLTATTVCLEFGKPDPHPRIAYRIVPIQSITDAPAVVELCRQIGRGSIDQPTAQAVAWHLANGLSWQRLADINRIESRYLGNIKFFQPVALNRAKQWIKERQAKPLETALSVPSASSEPFCQCFLSPAAFD